MSSYFRCFFCCLSLLLPYLGNAQVSDDFSDGDFTGNPVWAGTAADFIINTDEQLQVNNLAPSGADVSFLTTSFAATSLDEKEWQFWIKHGFSGSANNYGRFWLASSEANPTSASLTGYFIQFGEAGSNDAIELFYSNGGVTSSVCRGADALVAGSFEFRIRVRRDASGLWAIDIDQNGGYDFVPHASGTNATVSSTDHLGVVCVYTASNATKFYYDDIYFGDYILDLNAPTVVAVSTISDTQVDVRFNEPVTQASSENSGNYSADGGLGSPSAAVLDGGDPTLVHLTFGSPFSNGVTYQLTVSNVEDLSANVMTTVTEPFMYVITVAAGYREVVINEFMADENPSQGLPETEYVEVFNTTTDKFIDLTGWKLADNSSQGTIGSLILGPGEFALLVPMSGVALFPFTANVVGVTSWAALNNAGDDITLIDTSENIIDHVSYTDEWYGDAAKDDGGFSIEQINPFRSCTVQENWLASNDVNGGTPGAVNSIYDDAPDVTGPTMAGVTVTGPDAILLLLNEPIDEGSVSVSNISIEPAVGILLAGATLPSRLSIDLLFTESLDTGITYTVTVSGLSDCEGNQQVAADTASFLIPFNLRQGDLVINEVLFNPFTGGRDYVELYNRSERPVNLKGSLLANFDDDTVSNLRLITETNFAVLPSGYVCLTQDTNDVMGKYIQHGIGNFIQMSSLPAYNNELGNVLFLGPDTGLLERFDYHEDMHFPLLSDVKGVSLERLDPERSVEDPGNWHSAGQNIGFGTPGLRNSQYFPTSEAEGEVSLDPELFSPDNDSYHDVLNINYAFTDPGYVATLRIYDSNGRDVRTLATNVLLSTTGTFTWDGTTDKGEKARIGMYIILFEAFSSSGATSTHKLTAVLGGRL